MDLDSLIERAFSAFADDMRRDPPLSLRGANDVDSYDLPQAFDPARDQPTDAYLTQFAFWGIAHLDAASWRHYLPRLIEYSLRHPDDAAMVTEALVVSLRPPDRYPPRLRSLSGEQETVVRAFLELLASRTGSESSEQAAQALEEWWHPNARLRPSMDDVEAARRMQMVYREVGHRGYRMQLPDALTGIGEKDIPLEARRVATWAGCICGDVETMVAVNVTPLSACGFDDAVRSRLNQLQDARQSAIAVPGARAAVRVDGQAGWASPAEPRQMTMLLAVSGDELVTVSIRTWPREDVNREVERIVASLRLASE
jgi:hypothetical protein